MEPDGRPRIVLAPGVIAKSFLVEEYRAVLEAWRDGAFRTVVTRELLVCYLQLLRNLGLPDAQLRQWTAWFTAADKSLFLPEPGTASKNSRIILQDAARRGKAIAIVASEAPAAGASGEANWISVTDFLHRWASPP